jgi:signal transduction histidine kinase
LAAANHRLEAELIERKKVEAALREREEQMIKSLEKSEALEEQVRGMSRQILSAHEDERRKISRELHDVIAQALLGINARLSTLKTEAGMNAKGLARNISRTQKMISRSTEIVHKFARELRPAVLDDLGLVPALRSFMTSFTASTGVRTHLTAFEGIEHLDAMKRTVLYRIAQEALTNVGLHAHASRVDVTIRRDGRFVLMQVIDDGVSFQIQEVISSRKPKRLGLLGMRVRAEMVGGSFEVESAPGSGTTIVARIPVSKATEARWRKMSTKEAPSNP